MDSIHAVPQQLFQPEAFPDSTMVMQRLDDIISTLHHEGYLAARIDSLHLEQQKYHAFITSGAPFLWHITDTNVEEVILQSLNLAPLTGKEFSAPALQKVKQQLIRYYESNGYPFARIVMDQISIEEPIIKASLIAEPMSFYSFDTLQLAGNIQVNPRFLSNHTDIRPGEPYDQQIASMVSARLSELPFLKLTGEPSVTFIQQKARVSVPVEERRSNRFDGIAGLGGSGTPTDPYRLTGMLNLSLTNALERGESFDIQWQGLSQGSQRLEVKASYPYIFSSPVIAGMEFSLHKQDSSYITIRRMPRFAFRTASTILLSAFADFRSTNVLGSSPETIENGSPEPINSSVVLYGLEFLRQSPGFLNGFREGYRFGLSMAAGNRTIRKNIIANQKPIEDDDLRQNQWTFSLETSFRWPLLANLSLVSQLEASGIFAKRLYENELFRIGGFQDLKGFDEESIVASGFGVVTQELRYFTGEMSFVSLLFNAAWYQKDIPDHYLQGWPWGVAAGISLETAPGILSVYYALGKQPEVPLSFRNARIHFGFISLF
ncbi:MAG: hypothetical protein R6U64_02625 [Bacteroidales bacterium]